VPGLLAAGLAQAGCANHFAGFHIGLCIGNGWIAGRSAIEDLDRLPAPALNPDSIQAQYDDVMRPLRPNAQAESDGILRELQQIMFAYDVGILKQADRLEQALVKVDVLAKRLQDLGAPHFHELVRLKETEAMLHAAQLILGASMFRTESRLSHFRDDYPDRDDESWAVWVDATRAEDRPKLVKMPIPTPLCPIGSLQGRRPTRLRTGAIAGT
jgi:succinate dehydrogenase/fumarate reductase flavoprotein subunit